MMKERTWSRGRNVWTIRYWWSWYALKHFLVYLWNGWGELAVELRSQPGGMCYCPEGSTTGLRVAALNCGFWLRCVRDRVKRPCSCDKIMWLLFPDNYAEEIEEYGLARLQAEYPEVEPL